MRAASRSALGPRLERAARLHRARTAGALEGLGLFAGQERVLAALSGGPLAMSALAEVLGVQAPTATKTVARLGAQGLVERVGDEDGRHDGRTVRVGLTEAGRERAAAVAGIAAALEADFVEALGEGRARRLRKLLRRVERVLAAGRRPQTVGAGPGSPSSEGAATSDTPLSAATTSDSIGT